MVTLGQRIFIGFIAAIISNLAIGVFRKLNIDDTLDVFPTHGIGGIVGMVLTSVFAADVGLIYGEYNTFLMHLAAILVIGVYTLGMSYLLFKIVNLIPLFGFVKIKKK